jgi:hypothetical protein
MRIVVAVVLLSCIVPAAGAPFVLSGCSASGSAMTPAAPTCSSRVIVTFVQRLERDPDDAFVGSLAAAAGIQLAFLRSAGPGLYVFALADSESDSSCRDSVERLRRDARVRSVEIDARRRPHRAVYL